MKKINLLFTLFVFTLFSCGEHEDIVYNGDQVLVAFGKNTAELAIAIESTGEVEVPITVSWLSDADRVVSIAVDEENSTADPQNYSVPATVVIPAGSYEGKLVISGVDVTAETTPELLVLSISNFSQEGAVIGSKKLDVSVFQYCPIPEGAFTGNYLIEETTSFVDGPTLDHGQVVTVTATSSTGRRFMTRNYPNYCAPVVPFNFSLVCNEVIVQDAQRSTCACTASGLFFGPAITPATYDVDDDSVFYVTFTNDTTGDCSPAFQTTYKFTKQ